MKCTIKDIAEALHISRNTVSKALSGSPGVSDTTRRMIQEKAREMNYQNSIMEYNSSASAATLGSILFLTRASANYSEFWTNVLKGIESVLRPHSYSLVLGIMNENDLKNLLFPSILGDPMIKGIILVEICDERVISALFRYNLPIVTVDMPRDYEQIMGKLDIITMENKINLKLLVTKLIEKGASRFSFAGDIYSSNVGRGFQERYDALCETLKSFKLKLDDKCSLLYDTDDKFMDFPYLIDKIKKMQSLPDVFICGNDWTGIQLMHALQFLGYRIPKDVSIVGFDNIPESGKVHPPLTTIDTPKEQLGIAAANCIIERIKNPGIPRVYSQYTTSLIIRESTV
ncbi:LacI family DNA-binding transcriptional regulator [Anaerocolumna xylanovorans]|uniref:Transcriptional regulator, LacI family n=1 Tax=Anaerocolumna xylanovorans DSM 12503 TaxID=1121345 RepID=A0A1M7YCY1_9FIRM|nr:LacI family DNA-binding transcriptional regulator [Anaerocolumna xylanovorans]SHO50368.1 transcriptional regulator, LacI family [Anaerocolumna xylanovorans DSM 12503]